MNRHNLRARIERLAKRKAAGRPAVSCWDLIAGVATPDALGLNGRVLFDRLSARPARTPADAIEDQIAAVGRVTGIMALPQIPF